MNNVQEIFDKLDSKSPNHKGSKTIIVQYITNPDHSIRWLWPATASSPLFLKFYHIQGLKANIFALIIKFIFALRLQKLVFKSMKVVTKPSSLVGCQDWALFTGTMGPNQKYILYKKDRSSNNGSFTKIAITPQSQHLLNNENAAITSLKKEHKINFSFPTIMNDLNDTITFQENVSFCLRENKWTQQHTLLLQDLGKINTCAYSFSDFDQKLHLTSRIQSLQNGRNKVPSGIIKKLVLLHQSLQNKTIKTHFSHGDFTPWNVYTNASGELYVYDWELASDIHPLGYDYFHFIIQNGVLTQQKSWLEIKKEIYAFHDLTFFQNETEQYLAYYLLINVLNYLEVYEKQEHWHVQIHWLLQTWNVALSDCLSNQINHRELIVLDTFDHLHFSDYSGLKLSDQVEKVSAYSDIDLLMTKQTSAPLIDMLKKHPLVQKVHLQSGSAMTKLMILTHDNQLLSMDHIHQLKRKSLEYMNVSELIKRPYIDRHGIKKMDIMDSLQFIGLFYGLNNAAIPEKYRKYVHVFKTDNHALDTIINRQFGNGKPSQQELYKQICKLPLNQGLSAIWNTLFYMLDTCKNIGNQKGLMITFSGVDGAGKSTIIENTKIEIEKKLRKRVVVIRHRPSLLPIISAWSKGKKAAEKEAAETLPRQGQNKSFFSSLFRFSYYYTDYLFGQFYVYFKHVLRGDVVLYDRYYFDFINDSLRSNITLPKWILKSGYTFLLKPDLNFFLYADAQTILSRKRELNESTIDKLTKEYLSLFKLLGRRKANQYQAIENIHLERTLASISATIQSKLI